MPSRRLVYQQGDHICTLYSSPEEQLRAAVEYIVGGLSRGERCLYICGEHTPDELRKALQQSGVDVPAAESREALVLLTKHEAHLEGGAFSPDAMILKLHKAVKDSLEAGFEGLCAAGDMSWVLDDAPGTERVAEYELRLNEFYANSRALGLCQYNRRTIPEHILDHCIATHPIVRMDGPIALENPFYAPSIPSSQHPPRTSTRRKIAKLLAQRPRRSSTRRHS